jgi:hypothetical protein
MAARETTEKLVDVNQKLKQKCDDVVEVVAWVCRLEERGEASVRPLMT